MQLFGLDFVSKQTSDTCISVVIQIKEKIKGRIFVLFDM